MRQRRRKGVPKDRSLRGKIPDKNSFRHVLRHMEKLSKRMEESSREGI